MTRSQSREAGFLTVFEYSFGFSPIDDIMALARECRAVEFDEYSAELAHGVIGHLEEIDDRIRPHLRGYVLERISRISLAALRCSIWEFCVAQKIPAAISINEAVELTKKYGAPEDASFVNGVLGSIARQTAPSDSSEPQTDDER